MPDGWGAGEVAPAGGGDVAPGGATAMLEATGGKRSFFSLRSGQPLDAPAPETSPEWDLSLQGYLLQTNSGPSGPGKGGAYGPVIDKTFEDIKSAAVVPHPSAWRSDRITSPFDGWSLYNKCPEGMHTLASRHHVYGLDVGGKRHKLQILSYYGLVMGAPQGGRFTVRFSEVSSDGTGAARRIADLDASKTAVYLDLASGTVVTLSDADAKASMAWDVGFRKSDIFVNGGLAGPKGVRGIDLDANRMDADADVCKMTETSEQTRFEGVSAVTLGDASLRWKTSDLEGAFQKKWYVYDPASHQIAPAPGTWIVRAADGSTLFKLQVMAIDGPSMTDAGRVTVRFAAIPAM